MIVNEANLESLFTGFNATFTKGQSSAKSTYRDVAMVVPSTAGSEDYGWLGQFPKLREWIGDRQIKSLSVSKYNVDNKKFEMTIGVPRTSIEDDKYGIFSPIMQQMGQSSAEHPDELVYGVLSSGFSSNGYDDVPFFSAEHKINAGTADEKSISNLTDGEGKAWYLLDTTKSIRPLMFQERMPYKFTQLASDSDLNVFMRDEYIYGVRARANAGFGLWQLAAASKAPLGFEAYTAMRAAMGELKGDEGRPLGIVPNILVVPPSLEKDGRTLLSADLVEMGGLAVSNPWKGTATLIVSPWLS